ncbi:MAG: N-acetyltransferase [Saprospiraceae bacterium]|nr:N-acetyltransferase [Saprospiraceae bacterium]
MTENSSALSDSDDFFLNANYLQFIENNPPKDFTFCYLTFEQNHRMVGFMACQIKYFSAAQSLNFEQNENKSLPFKKWLAEKVAYNTLIVGNLMLTGDHSFFFKKDTLNFDEKKQLFTEGVNFAKQKLADQGTKINAVFIKDFELGSDNHRLIQSLEDYNEFQVEPNFVFNLRKEWQNFDDYLDALSSKYRVRAKRAFKKRQTLEFKEFNVERIIAYKDRIYTLYEQVCSNSAVNLIQLNPNYFVNLKNEFEDDFKLFGYLKDNQLLGFFTTLRNGEELEAHFLGYEMSQNAPYQIYLNMLFEIVKQGIDTRVKRIVFARTAHEIKSSIGAEAIEMSLFFKHENCLFNHVLPLTLPILSPREKWTPRQPFK